MCHEEFILQVSMQNLCCYFTDLRQSFKNLLMEHLPLPEVIVVLLGLSTTYFGSK